MPGWELIGEEEKNAVLEIFQNSNGIVFEHGFEALRNNRFRVRDLEQAFAKKLNYPYVQAVSSGTAGLLVALKALGVGPGDEVITQSFTFIATIEAIIECGATPIVVDIDDSLNIDPAKIEEAITEKTKVILPVHMLGSSAEMNKIVEIAHRHGLKVVEDACEMLGGSCLGKSIGICGDVGVFSLDGGKTITAGEGGLIVTSNLNIYNFCREYVDHGHQFYPGIPKGRDKSRFTGFNYRITEMQAAYALAQLEKLDYILKMNAINYEKLNTKLQAAGCQMRRLNDPEGDIRDTLVLTFENREKALKLIQALALEKLGTKILPDAADWHFIPNMPQFLNAHPLYKKDHWKRWEKSRDLIERSVAIPITVKMTEETIEKYAETVRKVLQQT